MIGKCREWTEEQVETAAVLCLVYGKFIEVSASNKTTFFKVLTEYLRSGVKKKLLSKVASSRGCYSRTQHMRSELHSMPSSTI